ncbi:hypothetical protein BN1263410077 [Stenotrophomonas indicatrix]|nr:hypothetical protein BN1263410077 [Stenotrophomonas indicatrix]
MQAGSRGGEAATVGDHHQGPQQVQFEHCSIRFGTVLHLNISLLDTRADFYHAGQGPAMAGAIAHEESHDAPPSLPAAPFGIGPHAAAVPAGHGHPGVYGDFPKRRRCAAARCRQPR